VQSKKSDWRWREKIPAQLKQQSKSGRKFGTEEETSEKIGVIWKTRKLKLNSRKDWVGWDKGHF